MNPRRLARAFAAVLALAPSLGLVKPPVALADPVGASIDSAANHFRHGVSLYKDGDYEGALVEFRRAQEVSPNYRVLYNIGQCLYQLQRYAEALKAFEDYLAQGGGSLSPARRQDVEGDLRALRARVGSLEVNVNVAGAEIRVDDQVVGTSPLNGPLTVSVGHRKVTVVKADRVPQEKFVDISVGDRVRVTFEFTAPVVQQQQPPPQPRTEIVSIPPPPPPEQPPSPPPPPPRPSYVWIPWTVTALFAAGTAATGGLALVEKNSLSNDLSTLPGNASNISRDANNTRTFAVASDICLAATAVAFVVALYASLKSPSHQATGLNLLPKPGSDGSSGPRLILDGARLRVDF